MSVWIAVHTPVGFESRRHECDSEEAAKKFLEDSVGETLEFVDAPSDTVAYRRMARPGRGGSAQYWSQ